MFILGYQKANLNPIHTLKWPFTMVFNRGLTQYSSFFLSVKHTIVTAITLAIPLFPLQVKGFLHVPWTITGDTFFRELAIWKASLPDTSSFFTCFYTSSKNKNKK